MKKTWIIIAASLIILGTIIFGSIMTMLKWDFSKLSTEKYQSISHKTTDDFDSISINSSTAKITFVLSDEYKVDCFESEKMPHAVYVQNGTLTITEKNNKKWYDYIGISFKTPKITVCLTKTQFNNLIIKNSTGDITVAKEFSFKNADVSLSTGDVNYFANTSDEVKIDVTTGDINVKDISAGNINLSNTTGKCELSDITCKQLSSRGTTGSISLSNVIAEQSMNIKRSTGRVLFEKSDAGEIFVKTTTGSVKGSLLSEKIFITKATTGEISVPQTTAGGKCQINTTTGDIKITVE